MGNASYKAPINPEILRWARESLAIDTKRAAKTASVTPERYLKWEYGEELPTVSMLRKLSNLYKRPLAVFFMPKVPEEPPTPTDFRATYPTEELELSTESRLAIRKATWNQSVAKDLMDDTGYEYGTIGESAVNLNDPAEEVANKFRKLGIEDQRSWTDNWEALRNWRRYLEHEGIFIFQYSMPLGEIRGFSLLRTGYPPVIVINSKDTVNGRIFTLFHEYGHYLLNRAGICNPYEIEFKDSNINETEKYCNNISGNFLVPTDHLEAYISSVQSSDIFELIYSLSREFKVSNFVVLKRLYNVDVINYTNYQGIYKRLLKQIRKTSSGGGNYYKNKYAEKGRKFISLVVEAESSNSITTSTALELLDVKLKNYTKIVDMLYE